MKKTETEIRKTQTPATGSETPRNDTDVEKEAAAMGIKHNPGHGQGGAGH